VVEMGSRLLPIEMKAARRVRLSDVGHLEIVLSDYSRQARFAVVLHHTDAPH
jgi:hypothetical protein